MQQSPPLPRVFPCHAVPVVLKRYTPLCEQTLQRECLCPPHLLSSGLIVQIKTLDSTIILQCPEWLSIGQSKLISSSYNCDKSTADNAVAVVDAFSLSIHLTSSDNGICRYLTLLRHYRGLGQRIDQGQETSSAIFLWSSCQTYIRTWFCGPVLLPPTYQSHTLKNTTTLIPAWAYHHWSNNTSCILPPHSC